MKSVYIFLLLINIGCYSCRPTEKPVKEVGERPEPSQKELEEKETIPEEIAESTIEELPVLQELYVISSEGSVGYEEPNITSKGLKVFKTGTYLPIIGEQEGWKIIRFKLQLVRLARIK